MKEQIPENPTPVRRKFPWGMMAVAMLFVIIPFLSWYGTWFGRELSDEQIESYINDDEKPRSIQHALEQLDKRMEKGDQSVKRWYPKIASLAAHPEPIIRKTAAWVMQNDSSSQEFHAALLSLLKDDDLMVTYQAALSLAAFNDASGRPELVRMLKFTTVRAEESGTIELLIKEEGLPVTDGAPIARIKKDDGQTVEIRATESGRVETLVVTDESRVEAGTDVMVMSPTIEQVWESLRALYLVGGMEDAPFVERYTRPLPGMPDQVQKQAAETMGAIRSRAR